MLEAFLLLSTNVIRNLCQVDCIPSLVDTTLNPWLFNVFRGNKC